MGTDLNDKRLFYNTIADDFDSIMDMYDTRKRLRIIFDDMLSERLNGKRILDAGCGTGWFSKEAHLRGGDVVSLDIGFNLLKKVREKCDTKGIAGDLLALPFKDGTFDIVISSEAIEHTEEPQLALRELVRVLKPDGTLAITTPNWIWHWAVVMGNALGMRRYQGNENWCGWWELKSWCAENNLVIKSIYGFHLFPFIFSFTHRMLDYLDRFGKVLGPIMLNIALKGEKKIE